MPGAKKLEISLYFGSREVTLNHSFKGHNRLSIILPLKCQLFIYYVFIVRNRYVYLFYISVVMICFTFIKIIFLADQKSMEMLAVKL